ncbi:MAG: sensor domain-containing protein [Candidatus Heimdallarchaeota archaeon]|nr:sensor domain-containing protein [Candidatus Heimdallarchaeota archaeon]
MEIATQSRNEMNLLEYSLNYISKIIFFISLLPIGIILFVYSILGITLSLGLSITIIGIPLGYLFLSSLPYLNRAIKQYISFMLGISTQKPIIQIYEGSFFEKLKSMIKSKEHQKILVNFVVFALPIGILLFVIFVALFSISVSSISMILYPIFRSILLSNGIGCGLQNLVSLDPTFIRWAHYIFSLLFPILGILVIKFTMKLVTAISPLISHF